jgi:uncharacterized protein
VQRGDGIVAVSATLHDTAAALIAHLVSPSSEIITVVTGADATAGDVEAVRSFVAEHHGHLHVEVHRGGQPLYPFLLGVE